MSLFKFVPILLLTALASFPALGESNDKTLADKLRMLPPEEWVYQGLAVLDMAQTMSALDDKCGCYKESNLFLGKNPSDLELVAWTAATGVLHGYITYKLIENDYPDWVIKTWTYTSIVVRAGVVYHNFSVGVKF